MCLGRDDHPRVSIEAFSVKGGDMAIGMMEGEIAESRTIDAYGIAEVGVCKDVWTVGDRQRGAPAPAGRVIVALERRDSWVTIRISTSIRERDSQDDGGNSLPMLSTKPVNMTEVETVLSGPSFGCNGC